MNERELFLVRAALAALEQNATCEADIIYAKRCLREAVEATEQGVAAELLPDDFCANCKQTWPCSCSGPVHSCGICAGVIGIGECQCDERGLVGLPAIV